MIDEKKLIEEIKKYHNGLKPKYASKLVDAEILDIIDIINEQPKVVDWIPVSTGVMPKKYEWVLVWYEYFRYGDYNRMHQTYGLSFYDVNGHWGGDVTGTNARCVAWMPLPDPYKV